MLQKYFKKQMHELQLDKYKKGKDWELYSSILDV